MLVTQLVLPEAIAEQAEGILPCVTAALAGKVEAALRPMTEQSWG